MIQWDNIKIQYRTKILLPSVSLQINKGESIGIIGENGTGKTVLAKALSGLTPVIGNAVNSFSNSVYVSFQSEFKLKHGAQGYRQQRWNWTDPEFIPSVKEEFSTLQNQEELKKLIQRFGFENHLDRFVISLSNGEQRKFELIKALSQNPDLLVIDNAINGLDKNSRALLNEMLNQLIAEKHSVILTGLNAEDFPEQIQQFIFIDKDQNCTHLHKNELPAPVKIESRKIEAIPYWEPSSFSELIRLNNLCLNVGEKVILKNINWTVQAGESWVLSGGNGSGKTSLLNMIFADNPKAYKCDIRLFGKQKGSGESIWEIKDQIGFVSPEMHQYLPGRQKVNDVICSGFYVSEGLYKKPTSFQRNLAVQWLNLIGLKHLSELKFETLSASAQRMVLLIRALIKNPPLVILDEPFQGLDKSNIQKMKDLITAVIEKTNCAMIFVSHFESEIPDGFDLEITLDNGEVKYSGARQK